METTTTQIPGHALRWAGHDHYRILGAIAAGRQLVDLLGDEPADLDEYELGHRLEQLARWGALDRPTSRDLTDVGRALLGHLASVYEMTFDEAKAAAEAKRAARN
jgi:hypothetical protein